MIYDIIQGAIAGIITVVLYTALKEFYFKPKEKKKK
jgi:hypothetical protein